MGIVDWIKGFFSKRESTKDAGTAIAGVKAAAESENYNQASMKAFKALEVVVEAFSDMRREEHVTAREFAGEIAEEGMVSEEELEPIIYNFEIAKYSEGQVSFDDYSTVEKSLESIAERFKSGKAKPTKKKRRARRRPRRRKTGAARSRKKEE